MRCKRFLACLLAVLLAFSLVPVGRAEAEEDWETAYRNFVLNEDFLEIGLSFHSDAYMQPRFSLYDLDGNGVPEMLAFNGGPSMAASTVYVFKTSPFGIAYVSNIGFRGCALYDHEDDPAPRLYCTDGNNGVVRTVCYEMHGGTITQEEWELDPDGEPRYLYFCTVAEIRDMGWDAFVRATVGAPDTPSVGTVVDTPDYQQFAANIFLSNFSEQHAFERRGFDVNNWNIDDIVNFAYLYCKINRRGAINVARNGDKAYYTLSLDEANSVWSRHFGFTLSEAEADTFPTKRPSDSYYDLGVFYFPAADGESYNRFTVVRQTEDRGDGTYRMVFDIYKLDIMQYSSDNGVASSFYWLTSAQAEQDSRLTWDNSGVAIVRPYMNNGNASYQLIRYMVGDEQEFSTPNEEPPVIEQQRTYPQSDSYSEDDPAGRSGNDSTGRSSEAPTSEAPLPAPDSAGEPVNDVRADGTEASLRGGEQSTPTLAVSEATQVKSFPWIILALALSILLICLIVLLVSREKEQRKKRR